MSKVVITGNASGTGDFTIAAPNSNTNRTLTLPDEAGTVLTTATAGLPINGPAFSAYANAVVSMPNSTYTKMLYQVERFDTNGAYDNSTSRFQPAVAGYYQVTAGFGVAHAALYYVMTFMFLNGSAFISSGTFTGQTNGYGRSSMSSLLYMNGTTDYLEIYGLQGSGGTRNSTGPSTADYFQGAMVRSAV